jgi:hypothetical protein
VKSAGQNGDIGISVLLPGWRRPRLHSQGVDDVVFVAKQEFRISKRDKTPSGWPKFAVGARVARLQLPAGCELKRFIRDTRDRFIGDGPDPIHPPKQ